MIPKIIHYCWFGGNSLPPLAEKCIASWHKFFPDYEIMRWDESNYDVHKIPYMSEAYAAKKYAFVSDYARFDILYHHGGLYFDTDVEVIRPFDDIIADGPFMGNEKGAMSNTLGIAPGLGLGVNPGLGLGVNPGLGLYKEMLELYATLKFINDNGSYNQKTVVAYTSEVLAKHGLKELDGTIQECAGIKIYPSEYFCPMDYRTNELKMTSKTHSIHHYSASWITPQQRMYKRFEKIVGKSLAQKVSKLFKELHIFK